jgi:hypothetical protein
MSEYVFKLKKGELELELRSDDAQFVEQQMQQWRQQLLQDTQAVGAGSR